MALRGSTTLYSRVLVQLAAVRVTHEGADASGGGGGGGGGGGVAQVMKIMVPLLKFYVHEEVRKAAVTTLPELVNDAKLAVQNQLPGLDPAHNSMAWVKSLGIGGGWRMSRLRLVSCSLAIRLGCGSVRLLE